jgi:S1-C subfamily serine protease
MKSLFQHAVLTVGVALFLTAPAQWARANADVYDKVLPSTGLILVPLGNGKDSQGTCWVVDHDRKLVITNNHVVTDKKDVIVFFPMFNNGEVIHLSSTHINSGERIAAQVIHRDVNRDLALVRLEKLPPSAKPVNLATKTARPGETVHSIGNSGYGGGTLWRYTRGQVRIVCPINITIPTGIIKAKIVETQGPINRGDSGGPLLNDRGDLVGVVSSFSPTDRAITWNIDASEVRNFLADADRAESVPVARAK